MHQCLNLLLLASVVGIEQVTGRLLQSVNIRFRRVMSFALALLIFAVLLVGLILGAFHD
ncbi:hypothetical protein LT85_3860 [Collimonas arenae]|uniref:Transmembrane protein n=2 Tax=Collimonas arenae TaxID=279058 RepID=A0A0A1FE28_9BURK|nr:hypothetical protein LT85_3860 [Collimonas arenae]